jgi:hypothetical protein
MQPNKALQIGSKYSKKDLSEILEQPTLKLVREGLYHCKNSDATLFFVDLEKKGKEERFHFDDYFEGDFFNWDSQTTQHINSPRIQEIVLGQRTPHLFVRVQPKFKNTTQPFVYCGRLVYSEHIEGTSRPVHMIFQNIDYDDFTQNEDLLAIYNWRPATIGGATKFDNLKKGVVSERRKANYKKPNQTQRSGLVTSRVGQGYYRQNIVQKWNGQCPVSKIDILEILIASHIVGWAESNNDERLDEENGILLAPHIDALFDRHMISFEDTGKIIISSKINADMRVKFGIDDALLIQVTDGMKKYLKKHRTKFYEKN